MLVPTLSNYALLIPVRTPSAETDEPPYPPTRINACVGDTPFPVREMKIAKLRGFCHVKWVLFVTGAVVFRQSAAKFAPLTGRRGR